MAFQQHQYDHEKSSAEGKTVYSTKTYGAGTTVAVYAEWHGGFYAWTMDYTISVQHLHAVYWDEEDQKFRDQEVCHGSEEHSSLTDAQYASVTVDAPQALLDAYATHLANVAYELEIGKRCSRECVVNRKRQIALVFKGIKVTPGGVGCSFWFAEDSDRLGLDPRPMGSQGRADAPLWVSGANVVAIPDDFAAALRPDELFGMPAWARAFTAMLPGGATAASTYRAMLTIAASPDKLDAVRTLGEALSADGDPKDRKASAKRAEIIDGMAVRLGLREPRPAKAPVAPKDPAAKKARKPSAPRKAKGSTMNAAVAQ